MLSIAKALIDSPELQAVAAGAVVWLILFALKKSGVVIAEGKDLEKRLGVVALSGLVLAAKAFVAWQMHGTQPDIGRIIAALVVAWVSATAAHTLTKRKSV